jgi:Tfp pilus assembly protein PilO
VLNSPVQLRVLLAVLIFGGWYAGFCSPMSAAIDERTRRADRERKRLELAGEVERLRAQVDRFQARLPLKTDPNEWVQYMLGGVRGFPLRLLMLDTDGEKDVGPYKAQVVKMQVEGGFHDVDAFLRWIETNTRLLRIDSVRITPTKDGRKVEAHLVVLGVRG